MILKIFLDLRNFTFGNEINEWVIFFLEKATKKTVDKLHEIEIELILTYNLLLFSLTHINFIYNSQLIIVYVYNLNTTDQRKDYFFKYRASLYYGVDCCIVKKVSFISDWPNAVILFAIIINKHVLLLTSLTHSTCKATL